MCGVCGCSHEAEHSHVSDHAHSSHAHHDLVRIEQDILAKNDGYAQANRERLRDAGVFAANLVSSPGAGKTTLLVKTIEALKGEIPLAVIEGDQQTSIDADRIRATGARSVQINTGRGCHLDAHMVGHALDGLPLERDSILFVENVGNLVCPAGFDLGEAQKIVLLSVTEGDDKPLKYPDVFAASDTMVLTKIDLLPHVDFDVDRCVEHARAINPEISVLRLSARTGEGMQSFIDWLMRSAHAGRERAEETLIHA